MKLFDLFVRCHLKKDDATPIFDSYIQSPNFTGKKKEVIPVLPSILFMGRSKPPKYAFCHFFVLTTAKGDRNYGCCILFGEKKKISTINAKHSKNETNLDQSNKNKNKIGRNEKKDKDTDYSKLIEEKENQSESESETDENVYLYAIALTSLLPLYQTLKNVLTCLLDLYPNDTEIARFIISQVPMPPPGVVAVQFSFCDTTFLVPRPPPNQLPLIDLPFWIPFSLFGPKDLIIIFTAILTEQRIVFSSRIPAAIAPFIESILTLIYPLSCYSTYIPNLASNMAPLLFSPLPYLIGVDPSVVPLDELEDDVLRVDLDTSSLFVAPNAIPPQIPTKPRQKLLKALRKMTKLFEEKNDVDDSSDDEDESSDEDENEDNDKKKKKKKSKSSRKNNLVSINDDDDENDDNDNTVKDNELIERKRKWFLKCSSLVKQPVETFNLEDFNFTVPTSAITLPLMNGLFPEMIDPNKKDLFATFLKVRDAFLRFIIVLLMNTKQVSGEEVDNKINQFDSDFYKLFIGTQCFDVFIHQLNEFKSRDCKVTNLDEAKLLFFLESVQAKKNRSKLNKSKLTPFLTSSHWQHTSLFVSPFIPSKDADFLNNDGQNLLKPCNVCDLVESPQTLTFSRNFTTPLKVVKSVVISSPLSYQAPFPVEKENKLKKILKLGSVKNAVLIEKTIRAFMCRKKYDEMKKAAIIIHSFARMANDKTFYNKKMKPAAIKIHSTVRMFLAKTKYKKMKKAAIMFQSAYRMYKQKMEYKRMKKAAIKIQSTYRMYKQRKEFLEMKKAAIKIQSTFRMYRQRKEFLEMKKAAIKIQSTFRMYVLKMRFKKMKESAKKIQSLFRGVLARNLFKNLLKEKKREERRKEKEKEKERKEKEKKKREKKEKKKLEKERQERERKEQEERERREQEERERREQEERERREQEERERREREERERREQEERERSEIEENQGPENISKERQVEIQNLLSENKPISLTDQAEYFAQLSGISFNEISTVKSKKKKKDKAVSIKKNSKEMKKNEKKIYKMISKVQKKKTTKTKFNGIFERFQIPVGSKKRKDKLNRKIFDILLLNPSNYSFEDTILASKLILIGEDKMSIKEIRNYLS